MFGAEPDYLLFENLLGRLSTDSVGRYVESLRAKSYLTMLDNGGFRWEWSYQRS